MCKNFVIITTNGVNRFESIGDIFVNSRENKERVVTHENAKRIHDDAMNRASYVRMRKHVHEIIV